MLRNASRELRGPGGQIHFVLRESAELVRVPYRSVQ